MLKRLGRVQIPRHINSDLLKKQIDWHHDLPSDYVLATHISNEVQVILCYDTSDHVDNDDHQQTGLLVIHGGHVLTVAGESLKTRRGDVIVFRSDLVHSLTPTSRGTLFCALCIDTDSQSELTLECVAEALDYVD